ncbi:MAG: glutamate racemase [Pseudomonadota bacterium]|nr:glutamate racemase [Pseudomonadota bacterium]
MPRQDAPIGVFDSGIGGLSVLRALRAALPHEHFVYFADSAHAPYGERDDAYVLARSRAVLAALRQSHGIKAFVIACNTATAAAARTLREEHPDALLVGIEPALKPALALTHTGRIGVWATRATLASGKFQTLYQAWSAQAEYVLQACDGLASAIDTEAISADSTPVRALIDRYLDALGPLGDAPGAIDTLVLGCTHYPLAREHLLASLAGRAVALLDPADAVARHTRTLLQAAGLARAASVAPQGQLTLRASGPDVALHAAAWRWLDA